MLSSDLQALVQRAADLEAENRDLRWKLKRAEARLRQLERQEEASLVTAPWEVLGVPQAATAEQVQAAFRSLARDHHPDLGGDPLRFQELVAARDSLLS